MNSPIGYCAKSIWQMSIPSFTLKIFDPIFSCSQASWWSFSVSSMGRSSSFLSCLIPTMMNSIPATKSDRQSRTSRFFILDGSFSQEGKIFMYKPTNKRSRWRSSWTNWDNLQAKTTKTSISLRRPSSFLSKGFRLLSRWSGWLKISVRRPMISKNKDSVFRLKKGTSWSIFKKWRASSKRKWSRPLSAWYWPMKKLKWNLGDISPISKMQSSCWWSCRLKTRK